ncbi:MAG TPA: DNA polymerase sliding clamp, partial [Methanomassiliicoccales archaeon]|nr:DNA polymerase sliding clamp [Methanomassiliicoccales archaeon]
MFQAKLRSDILKGIVDVVSTLIDEAKFKISDNGIQLKAVDPAHVAMIDLTLSKDAFEQYSAAETDLGLDLEKLKEVIRLSKSGDIIEMRQDEERGRLVLMVGNVTRRMNL